MADPFLQPFKANEDPAVVPQFFLHEGEECVRIQIAGNSRFSPVVPANSVYDRGDFGEEITYADRWAAQYQQFKQGTAQTADGTPLESAPFLNPSRIADLRMLKVYSVEGLATFDDRYISRLGGNGYRLKELAQEFLQKQVAPPLSGPDVAELLARIAALEAEKGTADPYASMDDRALKDEIERLAGQRPLGNPNRATLMGMLTDLKTEQAA